MAATVQGAYFFCNRVRSIPMYIGMSNDYYRPTKIASCAPGFRINDKMMDGINTVYTVTGVYRL